MKSLIVLSRAYLTHKGTHNGARCVYLAMLTDRGVHVMRDKQLAVVKSRKRDAARYAVINHKRPARNDAFAHATGHMKT